MFPSLACFYSSPKAGKLLFLCLVAAVMAVMVSKCVKRKMFNFWLPSVAQERLCLSSLVFRHGPPVSEVDGPLYEPAWSRKKKHLERV